MMRGRDLSRREIREFPLDPEDRTYRPAAIRKIEGVERKRDPAPVQGTGVDRFALFPGLESLAAHIEWLQSKG